MGHTIVHNHGARSIPAALSRLLHRPGIGLVAAVCLMLHSAGCAHHSADRGPVPQKHQTIEKQASPAATQQPDKARTVEKKPKEKTPAASADKASEKKLEQPEESGTDPFVPPPPLRPPSFGGAGG
jgi:hypothetical protein